MKISRFLSPGLVLLFLSPVIGELLSGSAPPAEFFNPLGFVMLAVLYGGGAILIRELVHRWGKGWPTLLALGAAYGVAEEALMCKSFFDPNWVDLGALGSYGRWLGVNWVWSVELTIYHAVFSIAIPILLVSIIFPLWRRRAWISGRKFYVLSVLWVANGIFIFLFISPYRPPVVQYLVAVAVTVGLCILGRYLPIRLPAPGKTRAVRPFWFLPVGFVATLTLFICVWIVPQTGVHPLITIFLVVGLAVVTGWLVLKMSGGAVAWSNRHQLALAAGALGFFILLAPMQELDKTRTDDASGMALVGLAMAIFVVWMALRVRAIESSEKRETAL